MVDILEDLARLQKLREAGVLNDTEFQTQKSLILSNRSSEDDINANEKKNIKVLIHSQTETLFSNLTTLDICTFGIYFGIALIISLSPYSFWKIFLLFSILSAIFIYIDARHIDVQGYEWNRAKWGYLIIVTGIFTIPIYIINRNSFSKDILQRYGDIIDLKIRSIYLIILYLVLLISLIYSLDATIALNRTTSTVSPINSDNSSAEMVDEPASAVASGSVNEFNAVEQKIIESWWETEEGCRGSSDAQLSAQWCARRTVTDAALNRAGICYGHNDDAAAAEYAIHRCRPGSFGYTAKSVASTTQTDVMATTWDCSYLYGEKISIKIGAGTYEFFPKNPDGGQSSGILIKGKTVQDSGSGTMDTPLTLQGSNSGEWALVDGIKGLALLHYAEGSGDGSECTVGGQGPKYATNAN